MTGALSLLLIGVSVLASTPAWSQQADQEVVRRHTLSGKEVLIRTHAEWNARCTTTQPPRITIIEAPKHGRIDLRSGEASLSSAYVGATDCSGQTGEGTQVVYSPEADFHGADSVTYEVRYHQGQGKVRTVRAEIGVD